VMLTEEVASVALNFGADDMDGTVGGENIAHDAGAVSPMSLAKDHIVKIIRDAGKIPVERDVYYHPLKLHTDHVIGKIPYLNSVPFYADFEKRGFKIFPVAPRRMGELSTANVIDAGIFSLMNYFSQEDGLDLLNYGIATRDQVKSVMLFSKEGWRDLEGKRIGITDDTATSIRLLQVLLKKKYGVHASLVRMHSGVNDHSEFDAVLLIGDEALKRNKFGLPGFELVFDLAKEWYDWQKLPFVFAVWAIKKSLPQEEKAQLKSLLESALERNESKLDLVGTLHGKQIGLSPSEVREYLEGFNYRLGERERTAMQVFRKLFEEIEVTI
jgi:chorismate dehydratase